MNSDFKKGLGAKSSSGDRHEALAALLAPLVHRIVCGGITIVTPRGGRIVHQGAAAGPQACVILHSWRAVRRLLFGGDVAFAEAYIDGDWSTPDLTAVIELAARNGETLNTAIGGSFLVRVVNRLRHVGRANTRRGSKRNIIAHYDLGNDFYRLWLDESMTYSSAIYAPGARETLEEAQAIKIRRIGDLLETGEGQSVLEIGCGWGALARSLARRGARVTGLTLSPSQLAFAQARGEEEGLSERLDLRLQDYRDVRGEFDRIVSIEMIEAVGERYWPAYFGALSARLRRGGCAVVQAITIAEDRFEDYRKAADFIQRYVFPGGMLPSKRVLRDMAARFGLELQSAECFADSYALTLAEWRRRMWRAAPQIAEQGFDARFRRLWDYYLSYCEAGFRARTIDVGLYKFVCAKT